MISIPLVARQKHGRPMTPRFRKSKNFIQVLSGSEEILLAVIKRYQANPKESHLVAVKRIFSGKLVCWSAKKQSSVDKSSAEAEYVDAAGCCAQVLWIKSQLADYDVLLTRYHFIRDHILKGDIELYFVPTELQLADIFTKPLAEPSFTRLVAELGMLNIKKEVSDKKKTLSDALT
ncbi:hypothetical protein Tco_1123126 [Tanacetum coccineum]|uniref:Uncharacterized protein n=1 Tax=Tanacetum coccineum TaxID=301880 RepID=A0ABQ5J3J4_9ASTR